MPASFRYDLLILDRSAHRYLARTETADGFSKAVSQLFRKERQLAQKPLSIYCRKLRTKDLQYMGDYEPGTSVSGSGESYRHLLMLSNGDAYEYDGEAFRRVFIGATTSVDLWQTLHR